ncbi:hypothetical protein F8154_12250 [Alkaliphilus pronyensis]|uniref:Uncharacterized protein n=1 Tax=Alkaliphilus pronyensis TaxID=1482732 RepID=A0A6I0FD90_9FIRM|nr:hypothetical protein [Alkaliphilus pronyensis]KAB3532137.1 hypothetical protein F8154_12250 [Alkaliphilus pronyensis]
MGKTNKKAYILQCEYCGKKYKSLGTKNRKYCSHDCYIRDRLWREEDAVKNVKMILKREKPKYIQKWLKNLLLSKV